MVSALLIASHQSGHCNAPHPNLAQNHIVPLPIWAKKYNLKPAVGASDGRLEFTNGSASLVFKTGLPLVEINGVRVWLSDPVTIHDGQPCISSLDLISTIDPILFPIKRLFPATVCLDPGHGGKDTGAVFGKYQEKHCTLPLAQELARQLAPAGFTVTLTRTNDSFVQLEDRPALANRDNAGLFISLHFNIALPGEGKGVEVYCLTPAGTPSTNAGENHGEPRRLPGNRQDAQNVLLAYELQKSLVNRLGAEDRGLRRARFEVLRTAQMPAVLIEGGFLADPDEGRRIAETTYRQRLAAAIVQGVLAYKHLTENCGTTSSAR